MSFNIREEFPLLAHHPELAYLDSAATTPQPARVLAAVQEFYEKEYASVHRGVYSLAEAATVQYEAVRERVRTFIGADGTYDIIFTANATAALNLAAWIEQHRLQAGDEILLSAAEHHSVILPWQRWSCIRGANLKWAELTSDFRFDTEDFKKKLSAQTKILAVTHISNVLGGVTPLQEVVEAAHRVGARVIVDAAQSVAHMPLEVARYQPDYVAFSAHKMYGPPGVGVLCAKKELLHDAEPFIVGGGTVKKVTRAATLWHDSPWKFEAGTPPVGEVIGLGAAVNYIESKSFELIARHEAVLTRYALEALQNVEGLRLYGSTTVEDRVPVFSFSLSVAGKTFHSHDVCAVASEEHVAMRGGHHCAESLMETLGVQELTRASLGVYNTKEDVDRLVMVLDKVVRRFGKMETVKIKMENDRSK